MYYNNVVATGVIVPDTSELLTEVQEEYQEAFGADTIVTPNTPQGVLITAEVEARDAVVRNNAVLANQINPNLSGGVYLDALIALFGGERLAQTYSSAIVNLTGVAGTVIPVGSIVTNTNGDEFASVSTVTLASDGTASVLFQAVQPGPITAVTGTLVNIINGVLGWETATNPADATLGTFQQSDIAARAYRNATLALQGSALAEAIRSGVRAVTGVIDNSFRENYSNETLTIDGVPMVPHSIFVCVNGGTDLDVATAILSKKSMGCNYNNSQGTPITQVVTDPVSGQEYTVLFSRPTFIPILIRVTVRATSAVVNPVDSITAAILAYANGQLNSETGFTIGSDVSSFEIAGAINQQVPGLYLNSVLTTKAANPVYSPDLIPINIWEAASITASGITVELV